MDPQPKNIEKQEELSAHRALREWARVLGREVPEVLPTDPKEITTLYDTVFRAACDKFASDFAHENNFPIEKYAQELEALRRAGETQKLADREKEIITAIQTAISTYRYDKTTNHPADILAKKQMNCVGATMLGGSLLKKMGIDCVSAETGSHVLLITRTSDDKVFWQDMQDGLEVAELKNTELTRELVNSADSSDPPITPEVISNFVKNPKQRTLSLLADRNLAQYSSITLREFFSGIELNELINTGFMLPEKDKTEEALEILEVARQRDPQNADIYIGFGKAYRKIGKKDEAMKAFSKALELEPGYPFAENAIKELKTETEKA